jgi:hypothetical protein
MALSDIICTCHHFRSVHAYDPADLGKAGPKKCGVPGCNCGEFLSIKTARLAKAEQDRQNILQAERERRAKYELDKK